MLNDNSCLAESFRIVFLSYVVLCCWDVLLCFMLLCYRSESDLRSCEETGTVAKKAQKNIAEIHFYDFYPMHITLLCCVVSSRFTLLCRVVVCFMILFCFE